MRLFSILASTITACVAYADAQPSIGPVAIGDRPAGALSGKVVYVHGGHGYTADNEGSGAWNTQRPLLLGMVEDLGNKDQMDFFVDHLFRSGATVAPLRPVGKQENEAVLDNNDAGVSFTGDWQEGKGGVHFGPASGAPYRFAKTSRRETAVARYRPNLPEAGVYPVYSWVTAGGNRAADQLYVVRHAGGATRVTVNHRRVGHGLVYLGAYQFEAGTGGGVDISNRSSEPGKVVIADMIRFGNGRGDIDRGGGVSGQPRENEAGLYWVMWHARQSQGVLPDNYRRSDADRSATVSLSPRYSQFMNREADGELSDRVFVSFHSNAGSSKARGVLGLINGNNYATSRTPNQLLLAETIAREINDDLIAQKGAFEHDWFDRGKVVTLDRTDIEFGELNNKYIGGEFDATIIETGFHDNQQDAEMLRDPRVRDAIARASLQGLIRYFHEVDGGATPTQMPPPAVAKLAVSAVRPGTATLTWAPPDPSEVNGDKPDGYVIYTSVGGHGFDAGRIVLGVETTRHTVSGLDPGEVYAFRIAARNQAGESAASPTLACLPRSAEKRVLIVDGFDRWDRSQNGANPYRGGGQADRVRPRVWAPRDHVGQTAQAMHAARAIAVDSTTNEQVADGVVQLGHYDAVFWLLGDESSRDRTFDDAEQAAVRAYCGAGGRLFVCGSEIAWDLDQLNHGRSFCHDVLRVRLKSDDSGSSSVTGEADSIFAGLSARFPNGVASYNVDSPDAFEPTSGAQPALLYDGGGMAAAIQYSEGEHRLVVSAVPIETVEDAADRQALLDRVLLFFGLTD